MIPKEVLTCRCETPRLTVASVGATVVLCKCGGWQDIGRNTEQAPPTLGLATTAQLLDELKARAEVGGYAEYRTVDDG